MGSYDLIIIGGGPGGYVAAIRAAQLGMKAAVVEMKRVGGTCLNRGCIPTKALLHSSHIYKEAREGARSGIHTEGISYDMPEIFARKSEVSEKLVSGVEGLLKANGVDVIEGFGTIVKAPVINNGKVTEPGEIRVIPVDACDDTIQKSEPGEVRVIPVDASGIVTSADEIQEAVCETHKADRIIIATGLIPAVPPFPGHELPGVLTSNDILEGPVIDPSSITIIGGSVIGVELATFYAELGVRVTLIEALDQLLSIVDKEFGQKLRLVLKKQGVDVHVKSAVTRIEREDSGLTCYFESKGKEQSVTSDAVLVATGRVPDMEGLLSDGISVDMDGRYIRVDENFETSVPGIYAIGDIIGGIQLAHLSSAEGSACVEKISGHEPETDLKVVPSCIYSDPEIATVGMTAEEAEEAGYEVITGKYLMAGNGKSIIDYQDIGFIKVIAEASSGRILGAHLMCSRASDIVGEFGTAIANRLTYRDMLKAIKPHPSFAEGVQEALEAVEKRSIHSAPVKDKN